MNNLTIFGDISLATKNDLCNRTVVVCSNYAWTVLNFRMPIIRRSKAEGYRVIVLTQFDGFENLLKVK